MRLFFARVGQIIAIQNGVNSDTNPKFTKQYVPYNYVSEYRLENKYHFVSLSINRGNDRAIRFISFHFFSSHFQEVQYHIACISKDMRSVI